jgi:peptide/nickel transport system permease protein
MTANRLFGLVLPSAWLVLAFGCAFAAPWLPLADPLYQDLLKMLEKPSGSLWFGADSLGRDVLSRSVYGLRVTFIVAIGSVALGFVLGGSLGLLAGYFRGRVERFIMAGNNVLLAFPPLVLAVAMMAYPGAPLPKLVLVLGLIVSSAFARISRVNTLRFAQQEFVVAAKAMGMRDLRIMLVEILPNLLTPLLVFGLIGVALAAVAEGTLSFLGLSVPPPTPTLGNMIGSEVSSLREAPHTVFFPAAVLFLTIFSLNRVGEYVQRKLDVRESAV